MCTKFKVGETYNDSDSNYAEGGSEWTVLSTAAMGEYPIVAQRTQDKFITTFTKEGKRNGYVSSGAYYLKPRMEKVVLTGKLFHNKAYDRWEYHAYSSDVPVHMGEVTPIAHNITVEVPRD